MAPPSDPLVLSRVVGDVVDNFVPFVTMSISYNAKQITNGCEVKPSMSADPPTVDISGDAREYYTLLMTDPDAPSPSEPHMREFVHWTVVDIPGGSDPTRGKEIVPYAAPMPTIGIHRYVFVLFRQNAGLGLIDHPPSRSNFNTRRFASRFGLGLPVATVYFNARKEPARKRKCN